MTSQLSLKSFEKLSALIYNYSEEDEALRLASYAAIHSLLMQKFLIREVSISQIPLILIENTNQLFGFEERTKPAEEILLNFRLALEVLLSSES